MTTKKKQSQAEKKNPNSSGSGKKVRLEFRNTSDLKPSPYSRKIYGKEKDPAFSTAVEKNGITTPLEILPNGVVISGNRRLEEAKRLGIKVLLVLVHYDLADVDELAIQHFVITANVARIKTQQVIDREAAELYRIQEARAERHKKAQLKQGTISRGAEPAPRGTEDVGETAAVVAKQAGTSRYRVRKIARVQGEIKRLKTEGNEEAAAKIEEAFNSEGLNAAEKRVAENQTSAKKPKHGKKGSKAGKGKKQIEFLEQRVKEYEEAGLTSSSKNLQKEVSGARKGAKTVPPLAALYRREKDLPQPTRFDALIDRNRAENAALKSFAGLEQDTKAMLPDLPDAPKSKACINYLCDWLDQALLVLETMATSSRDVVADGGSPAAEPEPAEGKSDEEGPEDDEETADRHGTDDDEGAVEDAIGDEIDGEDDETHDEAGEEEDDE